MLAELGVVATLISFITSLYAIGAALFGVWQKRDSFVLSARNATIWTAVSITVALMALWIAIMRQDYQIAYVWSVSSPDMPDFFRITALWGSQAGSLLFWSALMAWFAAIAVWTNWNAHRRLMPYVIAYSMATLAFFLGLSVFLENPFNRYWISSGGDVLQSALMPAGAEFPSARALAESAQGLNPLLRHFGMAIHPPMLYLGFVGFIIPFAFAMAALASGDLTTNWIKASRRWALIAWVFLSLGLLLGGRWAYDVLGWGGYWGWDPVENAAFLPWLVGTAYLHSVMVEEKRGMLRTWNMFLVIATFSSVIFGTFATRSGLVDSVHSFARSSIGFPMFFFWATLTVISVGLIMWRRNQGALRDDHQFASFTSREALFLLNNFIFGALFVAIFWGSFGAPITSELFFNTNITLGTDYFLQVTPPLFAALYILMGIAPLSAWGATALIRLGRALLPPLLLALLSAAIIALLEGFSGAVIGYTLVMFAGWVVIWETGRAIAARMRGQKENPLVAYLKLAGRNPRRYGGYMIHLGVAVIGLGVIASTVFQMETQRTLAVGESLEFGGYTISFASFEGGQVAEDGRVMDIANLIISRDGQTLAQIRPRRDWFPQGGGMETSTIAGAYSTIENDVYVLLVGWDEISASSATFKIYINPLINLVWWGGLILILGTVIAVWPHIVPQPRRVTLPQGAALKGVA